jgi:hypothetical protein
MDLPGLACHDRAGDNHASAELFPGIYVYTEGGYESGAKFALPLVPAPLRFAFISG